MQSIVLKGTADGLAAEVTGFVVGAEKRPTRASTPDDPRYWYGVHISPDDDARSSVMFFTTEAVAAAASERLAEDGAAFEVLAQVRISRRDNSTSLNLDSFTAVA